MSRIKTMLSEGVRLTIGGTAVGGITSIDAPGWSKTKIDDTDLDNTKLVTYVLSSLKEWNELSLTVKLAGADQIPEGNSQCVIIFGTAGTISFMGQLQEVGKPKIEPKAGIVRDMTISVTGLDASGNEVEPSDSFQG